MAITYQSIQSNTAGSGTTCVVTKPTGLAVGDLMVASSFQTGSTGITLPTGFTSTHSGSVGIRSYRTGYKIADAADVAASNFTFTAGSALGTMTASLIRLSTSLSFPTNPIIAASNLSSATSTANPSFSININSGPTTAFFVASYFTDLSVTSSAQTTSPTRTWTERYDFNTTNLSTSIATAPNTVSELLSTYSQTISSSHNAHVLSYMIIGEVQNATSDISHNAVTPTVEGITASQVNVSTNVSHLAITPTINGVATKNSSDGTVWQNETPPTTNWQNETL